MRRFPRGVARARPHGVALVALLLLAASPAAAQPQQPVSGFVVDARGAFPLYPDDEQTAAARGVTGAQLPSHGLGVEIGAHVYPLRWKVITFGVGASVLFSRGSKTPDVTDGSTDPAGPTVQARMSAFSPQLSLNFGHRMGWSYLSGGLGTATYRAWREDLAEEDGEATKSLNYGGGARWFLRRHLAFTLDLRFYSMTPKAASAQAFGHPRLTVVVASAGVSFR